MIHLDAPTQQQPTVVPAPTVGPAPDGYIGRHRASHGRRGERHLIDRPVPGDWSPLHPADRQALAPGWWATRQLPAGPDDRTGRLRLDDIQTARTEGPSA
ncbi:hypothetical protein GA0074692_0039 [Micromonospora pallida]|uniref:Uncharacterized protein n=1 Tax=Micromonospora pallida TaxID=145854 RepID=A0A1C6RH41_9ACTN|nr:hypothetical protein [Micromonospora pallida]SCL16480.1 hypothetical protein GA0074692_0039 [Micromonospora pallida]